VLRPSTVLRVFVKAAPVSLVKLAATVTPSRFVPITVTPGTRQRHVRPAISAPQVNVRHVFVVLEPADVMARPSRFAHSPVKAGTTSSPVPPVRFVRTASVRLVSVAQVASVVARMVRQLRFVTDLVPSGTVRPPALAVKRV